MPDQPMPSPAPTDPTSTPATSSPDIPLSQDAQSSDAQDATPPSSAPDPASAPAGTPPPAGAQPSAPGGDLESYTRQKAASLGIDPDTAVRVANTEGGLGDPTRQNMQGAPAYGPYQLYVGGPDNPGLGDEALRQGIDPRNPAHVYRAIDFALENAAKNGWGAFQGAAANGIGNWEGIGKAPTGAAPTPSGAATAQPAGMPSAPPAEDISQAALDDPDKWALCGPVAAIIAASQRGGNWTIAQAKRLAIANNLWDADNGMHGLGTEVALLKQMGVDAATGAADAG
jgi:hypothetical protein